MQPPTATVGRIFRRDRAPLARPRRGGAAALLAACVIVLLPLAVSRAAIAQGTLGTFADPRSGPEVEAWLLDEGLSPAAIEKAWPIHSSYLVEAARLRDGEIEAWILAGPVAHADHDAEATSATVRDQVVEARSRLDRKRRLAARLSQLEDRLWSEIAAAAEMPPESLARLAARGQRARWNTPRLQMHMGLGGEGGPFDTAAILARLRLDPEKAAAVRARLAGHDEAMGPLMEAMSVAVESERIRELESNLRMLEENAILQEEIAAEVAAANAEGRAPRLEEIHGDHHAEAMRIVNAANRGVQEAALAIHRHRMAAVRAAWELLEPAERLRLAAMLGVRDDYESMWPRIEARRRRGEISPETAARIEQVRRGFHERQSSMALELGTLRESGWSFGIGADGTPQPPPGFERMNELYSALWGESPMQMLRELMPLLDLTPLLAEQLREQGLSQSDAERTAALYLAFAAGGEEAGAEADREARSVVEDRMLSMLSPPPIEESLLEAIGSDLGIGGPQRAIAVELARDAAAEHDAIRERVGASIRAARDAGGVEGGGGLSPERIGAMLREHLAVDESLLLRLAAAAGAEPSRAALWIDWRHANGLAIAGGVRSRRNGGEWMGDAMPWEGGYAGVDAVAVLLAESPAALRDETVRREVAEHVARVRALQQAHLDAASRDLAAQRVLERAMWGDAVESPTDEAEAIANHEQRMALFEQHRALQEQVAEERSRLARAMRSDFDRLSATLPPALGRSLRAGIRRAAWPDAVVSMPGVDAINLAEAIAIEEEADTRVVEVATLANRYRARSEALFAMLDELARENERTRRSDAPRDDAARQMAWRWRGTAGRLAFRHRELDFEIFRAMRSLSGPAHADRFVWTEAPSEDRFGAMHLDSGID